MNPGYPLLLPLIYVWSETIARQFSWFSAVLSDRLVLQQDGWLRADDLRLLVAVGFTGSYTTFSTFEYEAHQLLDDGAGLLGVTYLVGSMFLGLIGVRAGVLLARW